MVGLRATGLWLTAFTVVCLTHNVLLITAEGLNGGWNQVSGVPTAMEVAEAAMRDLMQPGAHVGLNHQQRRLLQQDVEDAASAPEAADAPTPEMELPTPHVNLAPEVAQVEQLASHDLQQAAAAGKSALEKVGQGVQSINQQMRFPNPKNGPTPEYILSKIEDKVQEKAPLIQQKVFKIANDAYQHVDFTAIIDRALALSKNNILGAWPGQNPFGFNLDDKNFCLFAVPVLNNAPKEFNKMLNKGPLDQLDLQPLPEPNFFVKKPTALVQAEKSFKSQATKLERGMQDAVKHVLPTDIGADVSAKSVDSGSNKFVLNGLQSVASSAGKSATQEGEGAPEVRTVVVDGRNWACTPYEPSDTSNPATLSLLQTSMPKTAASVDVPALPNPASGFPSTLTDLSGKSGRRLKQDVASAEPTGQATVTGKLPKPDMTDTVNPAEGKIIDPFYGLPAAEAQTTNPITGEDKFSSFAQNSEGGYGDSYGGYGGGYGGYGYDDSMDFSAFSAGGSYGSLPPIRRPPLVTYNPETGGVTVRPPTSLLQSLGTHVDKFIQGNTGVPFFDCIGVKDAPPLNKFVSLAAKDAESLSQHFLSYLQTSNGRPVGFQIVNPFNRDAAPINVNFAQQKPYFQLPEGGRPGPGTNPFYNFAQNNNLPRLPALPRPPGLPNQPGMPGGPQNNFATQRGAVPQAIPLQNNANIGGHDWQSEQVAARAYDAAAAASVPAAAPMTAAAVMTAPAPVGIQQPEPEIAAKEVPVITAAVYDGYLSSCQVIIGSVPHADGTFDKTSDLTTTVLDGFFTLPALQASNAGVAYIVPAAKGNDYPKLDGTNSNPGFCFDTGMLLPEYNPLAVPLPTSASSTKIVASPLSTVLVFGMPMGLSQAQLQTALGIDPSMDINTLDALAATTADPKSPAIFVLKQAIKINNAVSLGANMLSNDSSTYASFAVTMFQAIAHQASSSLALPAAAGMAGGNQRRLLQDSKQVLQLSDPAIVSKVLNFAHQSVMQSSDPTVRDSVSPQVDDATIKATSSAIANVNAHTDSANNGLEIEKTSYLVQTKIIDALQKLMSGEMSAAEFQEEVGAEKLGSSLESIQLPGRLASTGVISGPEEVHAPTPTRAHKLSRGGIIAIAVVAVAAAVALMAYLAFIVVKRRSEQTAPTATGVNASGGSGRFWWKSPLWHRGQDHSPTTTQALASTARV